MPPDPPDDAPEAGGGPPCRRTLGHPVVVAAVAGVALVASWLVALQHPVPSWEVSLTSWANGAPVVVADVLYPVMQLGTIFAPLVVGGAVALWRRDVVAGVAVATAGVVGWFAAKGVKQLVERERPLAFVDGLVVREGDGAGLGYLSGHSTVAMATAVAVLAVVPRRWRWVPVVLAVLVGVARVVSGVHLPADVVGGWALGALIGVATLEVVDRTRAGAPPPAASRARNR